MSDVSSSADIIDSRDVLDRLTELESEREDLVSEAEDDTNVEQEVARKALEEWDESSDGEELKTLQELQSDCEGCSAEWSYGAQLIRDSYFEEYAQQLAEDIGAITDNMQWPCTCIDWEQAASKLQMDYTSVEYEGVTYWVR